MKTTYAMALLKGVAFNVVLSVAAAALGTLITVPTATAQPAPSTQTRSAPAPASSHAVTTSVMPATSAVQTDTVSTDVQLVGYSQGAAHAKSECPIGYSWYCHYTARVVVVAHWRTPNRFCETVRNNLNRPTSVAVDFGWLNIGHQHKVRAHGYRKVCRDVTPGRYPMSHLRARTDNDFDQPVASMSTHHRAWRNPTRKHPSFVSCYHFKEDGVLRMAIFSIRGTAPFYTKSRHVSGGTTGCISYAFGSQKHQRIKVTGHEGHGPFRIVDGIVTKLPA